MTMLRTVTALAVGQAKLAGALPRVHPNGFIQVDLSWDGTRVAKARLHVWPDGEDIPKQNVSTTIHDHRFDMVSHVLTGTLIQQTHRVLAVPGEHDLFTHEVHVARYPSPKESVLAPTSVRVQVLPGGTHYIHAGYDYYQNRYTFHDTGWVGLTATLMIKGGEDLEHEPRVLVPLGQAPDNDFVRADCSEDLLWDYIERALS